MEAHHKDISGAVGSEEFDGVAGAAHVAGIRKRTVGLAGASCPPDGPLPREEGDSIVDTFLAGQVALITGAGSGIGAATAVELARSGARIVLVGRRAQLLDQVRASIIEAGSEALAVPADVREYEQLEEAVGRTLETFGRIDIVVANAAIVDRGPIDSADPGLWRDVIATNVLGVMYTARAVVPHMLRQGSGYVVIISSGSGRHTYVGEPAYIASKHATIAFADSLRKEVTPRGIRVTVVEPGLVDTPLVRSSSFVGQHLPGVAPLSAEDCARAIRFAVSQPPNVDMFEIVLWPVTQVS
jgi:NADP-dependent 3-hydroxy acid dehydrogenase YdfG